MRRIFLILLIGFILGVTAEELGASCNKGEGSGTCVLISDCPKALDDIKNRVFPKLCGFDGNVPIVCCIKPKASKSGVISEARKECVLSEKSNKGQCVPLQQCPEASLQIGNKEIPQNCEIANEVCCETPKIVGEISKQKCRDYSSEVFEAFESPFKNEIINISTCFVSTDLVVGGTAAQNREFPHMALLGFEEDIVWLCGAALISEQFVLTSAHCTRSRESGLVRRIRLGVTHFSENEKENYSDFSVAKVFVHPNYSPRSRQNDIAIIKMDRPTKFNKFIRPGCLNVNSEIPQQKYFETTWVSKRMEEQNVQMELHKLIAKPVSNDKCSASIKNISNRIKIDPNTQLCAQLGEESRFFYNEQSTGGPLQVYHPDIYCMYSIIGVASFGSSVNNKNIPDVYTRVSNYTEWIEKIVWP